MTSTDDDQLEPDRFPLSPEARAQLAKMLERMIDTPEMRASVKRLNLVGQTFELQVGKQFESQVRQLINPAAMEQMRAQLAALTSQADLVQANLLASMLPQMEQLNRSVFAALTASGTSRTSGSANLSASVNVAAEGLVSEVGPVVDPSVDSDRANAGGAPINIKQAIMIVITFYSFLQDFTDDNFAEATRNSLWSLALLLVVLAMQSERRR